MESKALCLILQDYASMTFILNLILIGFINGDGNHSVVNQFVVFYNNKTSPVGSAVILWLGCMRSCCHLVTC